MRIFKKILIVIAILIAALLVIGLFTKKEYTVSREITINKPKQEVFDYLKHLKNQQYFNTWAQKDPNAKHEEKGTDGTVGFVFTWKSENNDVGEGIQEIKSIREGERIDYDIQFIEPFSGQAKCFMSTDDTGNNQTHVKWGFDSGMKYPMNIMMIFIDIPGMLGKEMDKSLVNLKNTLEK